MLDGLPHPRVRDGEKIDLPLGYQTLQQLVREESQVHAFRAWPDQDMVRLEDKVHRLDGEAFLLLQVERWQGLRSALLIDMVNEVQPLQRMYPGDLGPEHAVGREQGSD